MSKDKYLFLDVDGVLNTGINIKMKQANNEPYKSYNIKLPGDKIYRLKRIIDATNALIILSSSWRIGFSVKTMTPSPAFINLQNQLGQYGLIIFDSTPLHPNRNRGQEIMDWLNSYTNHNNINYAIIDNDIGDLIYFHKGHIVHTNSTLGLQDEHVNIAINILNQ